MFEVLASERTGARSPKPNTSFKENINLVAVPSSDSKSVCYATPTPRSRDPDKLHDFHLFAWINEHGLWGRG